MAVDHEIGDGLQHRVGDTFTTENRLFFMQADDQVAILTDELLHCLVPAFNRIADLGSEGRIQANSHNGVVQSLEGLDRITQLVSLFHGSGS